MLSYLVQLKDGPYQKITSLCSYSYCVSMKYLGMGLFIMQLDSGTVYVAQFKTRSPKLYDKHKYWVSIRSENTIFSLYAHSTTHVHTVYVQASKTLGENDTPLKNFLINAETFSVE